MKVQNFVLTAGEDRTLSMTALTQSNAVLNLTGATILWRLSQSRGGTAVLSKAGAITVAASGTFTVTLTAAETTGLSALTSYYHQAIVTVGGVTTVACAGKVTMGALNQPVFQ